MKRILTALMISCMLTATFAGCGGGSASSADSGATAPSAASTENSEASAAPEAAAASGETTKFSVWLFNDLHQIIFDGALETWNAEHPDQPIETAIEIYPNIDMHNKLTMALQSGVGAPDIVDVNTTNFANFLRGTPSFVPLDDIVAREIENCVASRFDVYSKDGVCYGLPTHVGAGVVYYNSTIMEQAGINPADITTWAEYTEAGKTVLETTGVPMTAIETTNQWPLWPMIVQNGGDYLDKDNKSILASDSNIEVATLMQNWMFVDKIAIPCAGGDTGKEEFWSVMNQGGIASLPHASWYMSRIMAYMPDLEGIIEIQPMPVMKEGQSRTSGVGGTGTAITVQCQNQELAKEYLHMAKLTKEASIRIYTEVGFDPIRWDVWDDPQLTDAGYFKNSFTQVMLPYVKENCPSPTYTESIAAAQDIVKGTVAYKLFVDQEDVKTVLEAASAELDSAM